MSTIVDNRRLKVKGIRFIICFRIVVTTMTGSVETTCVPDVIKYFQVNTVAMQVLMITTPFN